MYGTQIARVLAVVFLLVGAASPSPYRQTQGEASTKLTAPAIQYRNASYGFCVSLPASWKGYSIVSDHWDGFNNNGPQGYQVVEHGPLILIRHPLWTKQNPRQDIPIMVFTRKQWDSLEKDEFPLAQRLLGRVDSDGTANMCLPCRRAITSLTCPE